MPDLLSTVSPEAVRAALATFWGEQLRIEQRRDRLVLALPLMDAEGWQIVISLQPIAPARAILTDRGETLARLENGGLDLESESAVRLLDEPQAQKAGRTF